MGQVPFENPSCSASDRRCHARKISQGKRFLTYFSGGDTVCSLLGLSLWDDPAACYEGLKGNCLNLHIYHVLLFMCPQLQAGAFFQDVYMVRMLCGVLGDSLLDAANSGQAQCSSTERMTLVGPSFETCSFFGTMRVALVLRFSMPEQGFVCCVHLGPS